MAGNAQIGALHVALGLDSAQFTNGLKLAQGDIGKFGKIAAAGMLAVATAAVGAATALGVAVRHAANHADELGKTAQKVGVTVEALSRLEWAAKLSDVSLEELSGGLGKLSRAMVDVAAGSTGPAASAFAALGISVKDAAGNVRDGDAVFADIADRFSRMEDGAVKTALAIQLFGKAGAGLIPLLNSGRQGLADMAAESDRLGQTISTKTAKSAEAFNDNLTRLEGALGGVANRTMEAVIPGMQALSNTFADPYFQNAIASTTGLLVTLADVLARTAMLAFEVANILPKAVGQSEDSVVKQMQTDFANMDRETFDKTYGVGDVNAPAKGTGAITPGGLPDLKPFTVDVEALGTATKKADEYLSPFQARMGELSGVLTATVDPFEQMKLDLTDLETMFREKAISAEQFGNAVSKTYWNMATSIADSLSGVSGVLADLFKDNKAFAIANVAISTAAGAMKAFEQGGIFGWIGAGSIIAAGAGQIANILATEPGNAKTPSLSGGSGSGSAAAAAQQGSAVSLTIKGSGNINMDDLAAGLAKTIGKGGAQPLVNVIREL